MSALLWALVVLPLAAGAALLLAGRAADRAAPAAALGTALAVLALAVAAAVARPAASAPLLRRWPVGLAVDGLSAVAAVTVAAVTLAVLAFAAAAFGAGELAADDARARFYGLMLLFSGSMLVTVTATTLPVLLMAWEVMGATSWALIGYWWHEPDRVAAAGTAFLVTRTADLGLYLAAGAAVAGAPAASLALDDLPRTAEPWLSVVTAGVIAAAFGKSAQLPFSFWLSRAMQGPSPVSALLHSATMVAAGAYLLLRTGPLLDAAGWGGGVVAWTGAATALALGLVAVAQTDLKQLLAASTCAQVGLMVLAAGAAGTTGGALQLTAHAAAKSLLFLAAGAWLAALGTKALPALRGAARHHRTVGVAATVGALALAGLPPLALWAAKDVLLAAALEHGAWLYAAGLAAGVLSAVYSARLLWFVWRPVPPRQSARRVPAGAGPPLALLAAACVALTPLAVEPLRGHLARALGAAGEPAPHGWELALSAALALAAAAGAWAWGERPVRLPGALRAWCREWLLLGAAADRLVARPVMALARASAAFDDRMLGRIVERSGGAALGLARASAAVDDRLLARAVAGSGHAALGLARWTDRALERAVDGAVGGVAAAARALGRLARRPQTGQVHAYLAQAVAAFTVLAVVLVLVR